MNLALVANNDSAHDGQSLVEKAMQAVRTHIRQHDLKVGDNLPGEGSFATELGVSRAVMREAFGALAALKLIDVGNGRRARVAAMDGAALAAALDHAVATAQISVVDIWDVRRTVEVRIAMLAAERRTETEALEIVRLANAMRDSAGDLAEMTKYDIAFHIAIATACRNPLFSQMVNSFAPLMEVAVPKAWETRTARSRRDLMIGRHAALAHAIAMRDSEGARIAMEAHFDASIGDLLLSNS